MQARTNSLCGVEVERVTRASSARSSGAMTRGTGRGPDMPALITWQISEINPERISGLRY